MAQAIALGKRPHIVVGTPGRVVDHLSNTKGFSLKGLKHLVLDEADKLLDMDFEVRPCVRNVCGGLSGFWRWSFRDGHRRLGCWKKLPSRWGRRNRRVGTVGLAAREGGVWLLGRQWEGSQAESERACRQRVGGLAGGEWGRSQAE
eukprot:125371-Chlamydomonas_euryale.AAC.1